MERDHNHPENVYKDLIYKHTRDFPQFESRLPAGLEATQLFFKSIERPDISAPRGKSRIDDVKLPDGSYPELCWSCGWNVYHQVISSYGSRIRIFHTRGNMG